MIFTAKADERLGNRFNPVSSGAASDYKFMIFASAKSGIKSFKSPDDVAADE